MNSRIRIIGEIRRFDKCAAFENRMIIPVSAIIIHDLSPYRRKIAMLRIIKDVRKSGIIWLI